MPDLHEAFENIIPRSADRDLAGTPKCRCAMYQPRDNYISLAKIVILQGLITVAKLTAKEDYSPRTDRPDHSKHVHVMLCTGTDGRYS